MSLRGKRDENQQTERTMKREIPVLRLRNRSAARNSKLLPSSLSSSSDCTFLLEEFKMAEGDAASRLNIRGVSSLYSMIAANQRGYYFLLERKVGREDKHNQMARSGNSSSVAATEPVYPHSLIRCHPDNDISKSQFIVKVEG